MDRLAITDDKQMENKHFVLLYVKFVCKFLITGNLVSENFKKYLVVSLDCGSVTSKNSQMVDCSQLRFWKQAVVWDFSETQPRQTVLVNYILELI